MEITEEQKRTWHDVKVTGTWDLKYKVTNPMGPMAFGGQHLEVYENPYTFEKTYLKSPDGKAKKGWLMDKNHIKLYPDKNKKDYLLVHWLIAHPKVKVEGVEIDSKLKESKQSSTKIRLIAVDANKINEIEQEDFQDKLIGRVSLDGGKKAIGLEDLRAVLAYMNLPYFDNRYEDKRIEKKALRSTLKKTIRKSYEEAQIVYHALNQLDQAKAVLEFKEMSRHRVLIFERGMYKYNRSPVGANFAEVKVFFDNNPEVKAAALLDLDKKQQ